MCLAAKLISPVLAASLYWSSIDWLYIGLHHVGIPVTRNCIYLQIRLSDWP